MDSLRLRLLAALVWLKNVVYALDLLVNAVFGGERHQTISARWGQSRTKVWLFYWGCRVLDRLQLRHCERAREQYARIRAALPDGGQDQSGETG